MQTEQFRTLLKNSTHYFQNRNLKKALNSARILLEFAGNNADENDYIARANILLGMIYTTNGLYQNDRTFFHKAVKYFEEADKLNIFQNNTELKVKIFLSSGEAYLNYPDFNLAKNYFYKAFLLSSKERYNKGIVLSLISFCKLFLNTGELDKAEKYSSDAHLLFANSELNDDVELSLEVYNILSKVYLQKGNFSISLDNSQKLLDISREYKNPENELTALNNISIICRKTGNYKIGIQYSLEALNKSKKIGYEYFIIQSLMNLAKISHKLSNYQEAIDRYEEILDFYSESIDDQILAVIHYQLGLLNRKIEDFHNSEKLLFQALQYSKGTNFNHLQALICTQLAKIKISSKQITEAEKYADLAKEWFTISKNTKGEYANKLNFGHLYFIKKEYENAISCVQESLQVAKKEKDLSSQIESNLLLSEIYKAQNNYKKALSVKEGCLEKQMEYSKLQRKMLFLDLSVRHEIKEKERQIEDLTKEDKRKTVVLSKSESIEKQNIELKQVNDDLKKFAYAASHDLKEPLRMIGSYSQLLERHLSGEQNEDTLLFFKYIKEGVKRMTDLLDALLRYATVDNTDIQLEDIDLNEIVEIIKIHLKTLIEDSNAIIISEKLPVVLSNRPFITQLFQNIIANAIKFRKPGQNPEILIKFSKADKTIRIKDDGIGIESEFLREIFEPFRKLHPKSKYPGSGIGLAICKKIVDNLNGKIWVESKKNEGSTFLIFLPKYS